MMADQAALSFATGTILGIDLDNTILSYDQAILAVALRMKLVDAQAPRDKRRLRDLIRRNPEGDVAWQRVQAEIYGPAISHAVLIDGVIRFLTRCRQHGVTVHIVSHKTKRANYDTTGTDLRFAALGWLENNGIFSLDGPGLPRANVWFADTRAEKVDRIVDLGCSWFIDDLLEVFEEPSFPSSIGRILFDPTGASSVMPGMLRMADWPSIERWAFGG